MCGLRRDMNTTWRCPETLNKILIMTYIDMTYNAPHLENKSNTVVLQ